MARRILKICGIIIGIAVLLVGGVLAYASIAWDNQVAREVRPFTAPKDSVTLVRGEFLYKASLNCWACHGNEETATAPPSGGKKFDMTVLSPSLGVYYAANITPDVETGIGGWSDGEIVRAIREGVRHDGRVLFPIMPTDPFNGLSDEDALALVAYLRSIPPVKNAVPRKNPSLFAKTLIALGVIGPTKERVEPVIAPARALTPLYGEYVVRHASLCSDCHTPRNLQTGDFYYDSLLAGSSFKFGDEGIDPVFAQASNITPDKETGIGTWTEEEFLRMMRTGVGPDGKVRSRHMPYAYYGLWDSLELRAVYQFIQTIKPIHRPEVPVTFAGEMLATSPAERGKGIFKSYCISCHGKEGKGAMPTNVVLASVSESLSDTELMEFVKTGNPDLRMPGFGGTLSENDLKAVVTYIRTWEKQPALTSR